MAQPNSGQNGAPLIRPSQIDNLPHMTAEQKQHYKAGLTKLWQTLETFPKGSQQYLTAEAKIKDASLRVMQQISTTGNRPNSGGGPQQQQQQQQQQQRPPGQQGGPQGGMPQASNMAQQGSSQGGQPQQGQQQPQISQAVQVELRAITVHYPPGIQQQGQQAMNQYKSGWYRKAADLLTRRDAIKARGVGLQQQVAGNPALSNELEKCRAEMRQAVSNWDSMKKQNASMDPAAAQNMQRQQGAQAPNQQQMNGNQLPQQSGDVKMQMDQGSSQSPQTAQGAFQQQQQTAQNPITSTTAQQQNMPQPPNSAHPQNTPQTATQTQPPQNFPLQNNMQQPHPNQPQRPQMNAQQMQQAQQNMVQAQQQQNAANSAMAQSATQQRPPQQQQQQQRPQPLTHQAAMSQAAENYSRQQSQNQNQQQQPAQMPTVPNGLPLNPPPSATNTTPTSAYPALQQGSTTTSNSSKFPINRTLQLDPRTQQPVQGQPSRPTFANAGMMSQPGVQRAAQFTLEGEGDRVLSKRKLDELVRQVTGTTTGPSGSAATDGDGGVLAPDVEEAVLTLADDFVDNVITAACRLAKLRSSQTLDIRDVQIVLERNYGIRIPGYGLDEVRTVRKFQPAPGWQSKMQAVQAGKVMGGVGKEN